MDEFSNFNMNERTGVMVIEMMFVLNNDVNVKT